MCLISVPNLKEIHSEEGGFWLKVIVLNRCKEEENEENEAIFRNAYLKNYLADFLQIWYAKGIKYVEIGPVVIEI